VHDSRTYFAHPFFNGIIMKIITFFEELGEKIRKNEMMRNLKNGIIMVLFK
jgi:hypothetical protein